MFYRFQWRDQVYEVSLDRLGEAYRGTVNGEPVAFEVLEASPGEIVLRIGDRSVRLYWAAEGGRKWVSLDGCTFQLERPLPKTARAAGDAGGVESVRAPMPAQVRAVQAGEGEAVEQGQTLLLLEAMKMEIRIKAPTKGVIKRVLVKAGQAVEKDQALAEIGE